MHRLKVLFLGLFIALNAFGTIQIPDVLIYNGDTILIETYPLELYFKDKNPRPDSVFIKDCLNTACWRSYQAVWKIESDSLFLISILDCCADVKLVLLDSVYNELEELLSPSNMEALAPFRGNYLNASFGLARLKSKMGEIEYYKYHDKILEIALRPRKSIDLNLIFNSQNNYGYIYASWFSGKLNIRPSKVDFEDIKMSKALDFETGVLIRNIEQSDSGTNSQLPSP